MHGSLIQDESSNAFHHNYEITVMGVLISCDTDERILILDKLKEEDLQLESNRTIYRAVRELASEEDTPVDILTVSARLREKGQFENIGGFLYLSQITEGIPRNARVDHYIDEMKLITMRRRLWQVAHETEQRCLDPTEDVESLTERMAASAEAIRQSNITSELTHVGDFISNELDSPEKIFTPVFGTPSGYAWLDEKTRGFIPEDLIVVAARPSMGKTAWVTSTLIQTCIINDDDMALFTFEQKKRAILERLVCGRARVSLAALRAGNLDAKERSWVIEALREIKRSPIHWDDTAGLSVHQIRARLMRLKTKLERDGRKLKGAMIDQLSFIPLADYLTGQKKTHDAIGDVTRDLKKIGHDLKIPIILLCQIGRSSTKNKDNEPTMADLAESGKIEQNADTILFLHRPEYYVRDDASLKGKGKFILAKQRQGPTGSHMVRYTGPMCRWADLWQPGSREEDESPEAFSLPGMDTEPSDVPF